MKRLDFTRALSATAFGTAAGPAAAQTTTDLTTIRLGTNVNNDSTPLFWAVTSGIFARAGLKVDIQKFNSGTVAIAALVGGSLDIARGSLLPLISARAHGIPIQIVAPAELSVVGDSSEGIVALKESTVTTGKDLNGATMPVPALHDFDEVSTRAWIDATGGDSKTVKFIELPSSAVLASLLAGRVKAAFLSDPFLTSAVASGRTKVIAHPNASIAPRFLITCYCSTETFVDKNRAAIRRFADALGRSATYTNAHHAEVLATVAPFWGVDPAVVNAMTPTVGASRLDPREIQPLLDAALRYGVIPAPITAKSMIAPGVI
ncbi:MAG TPA: ABC transporter substrate-binding protein [Candidatus Lustribacter sp.]|jgi:NitT/TauT family transport system substrate-binding protein|nr:ABC transporter substrate-binding protein [Candidatus Lustribacter sp.]